jgi:hypothetical protein
MLYINHYSGYNFSYDTTVLTNGSHTYYVKETANDGSIVNTTSKSFNVSNATPGITTINLSSPIDVDLPVAASKVYKFRPSSTGT